MSGYGYLGAADALREFGRSVQGFYGSREDRLAREKAEAQRQQALDDDRQRDAVALALQREGMELADTRAQEGLRLQREASARAQADSLRQGRADVRSRALQMGPGVALPESLTQDATSFGILDEIATPGGALPEGQVGPPTPPLTREMRSPDELLKSAAFTEDQDLQRRGFEDQLKNSAALRALYAKQGEMYGRSGNKQDARPELARAFPSIASNYRSLQGMLQKAQADLDQITDEFMRPTRAAEVEALKTEAALARALYMEAMRVLAQGDETTLPALDAALGGATVIPGAGARGQGTMTPPAQRGVRPR